MVVKKMRFSLLPQRFIFFVLKLAYRLVPYFPLFLYAAITGKKDYSYISMLTLNYLGPSGWYEKDQNENNKTTDNKSRKGMMYGGRYSFLIRKKKIDSFFQNSVGLSF